MSSAFQGPSEDETQYLMGIIEEYVCYISLYDIIVDRHPLSVATMTLFAVLSWIIFMLKDYWLWFAAEHNLPFLIEILAKLGADVNGAGQYPLTPCCIAAHNGHKDVVKLLLELGATLGDETGLGETACHIAARKGQTEILMLLLDHEADINYTDDLNFTPLSNSLILYHAHLLPIFRQAYIQQHLLTPPQLTSFPNTNSFSSIKIDSSRFLFHYVHHRMSSCQIRGYMDKRGLVLNGMRELVVRFPDILSLEEDEGRVCGYKVLVRCWKLNNECSEALLFWESEGGYVLIG